jgi:hypothetical protein
MLPEEGEFAYVAAKEAFAQAQVTPEQIKELQCGIIFLRTKRTHGVKRYHAR